jgi:hypothetical protein
MKITKCAVTDCENAAVSVSDISIDGNPKQRLPVCSQHADAAEEDRLTEKHMAIMEHTQNRAASGLYCGDSPEMQDLVRWGLMAYAGRKPFVPDSFFQLTSKGREFLTNRK